MKIKILFAGLSVFGAFGLLSGQVANLEKRDMLKIQFDETPSWIKIGVSPEKWIGKNVSLTGWLDFSMGSSGQIGNLFLYETQEDFDFKIRQKSVAVSYDSILKACEVDGFDSKSLLIMLHRKCVSIRGELNYYDSAYCIARLSGEIGVRVNIKQDVDGIPKEMLEF